MSTRSGARVYRRAPKPVADGACPHCQKIVRIAESGRRWAHDMEGALCTGSGIMVQAVEYAIDLDEADAALQESLTCEERWRRRDRTQPANPWSGKA